MICHRCHNGGSSFRYGWPYAVQDRPMLENLYCNRDIFDHGFRYGFSCALENCPMPQIVSSTPHTEADVRLCASWKYIPLAIYRYHMHSGRYSPYMYFQIVFLCKATRACVVWTNIWFLTRMCPAMKLNEITDNFQIAIDELLTGTALPDMDLKLGGTFESFLAFIACLWHLGLWFWSTFLTFFGQFFLVSISMRTGIWNEYSEKRKSQLLLNTELHSVVEFITFLIFSSICQCVRWSQFSWMFLDCRYLFRCPARRILCPECPSTNAIVGQNFHTAVWSDRQCPDDTYNCCKLPVANHHFCTPKNRLAFIFYLNQIFNCRILRIEMKENVL